MAYLVSYNATGNREDLSDIIKNISPDETPIYSVTGTESASNTLYSWQEEELRQPKDNAAVEGADFNVEAGQEPVNKNNYTQIFTQAYGVSNTEQTVKKAGIKDLMARRMRNAMKEVALDVEYAIVKNAAKVAGSATVGRKTGGIPALITTNINANGGTPRALTEDLFNNTLQAAWSKGGKPDKVFVSGTNKRNISKFTGSSTKNVDAKDKRLVASVDVYESSFGIVSIIPHRQIANDNIPFLQTDMLDMHVLRPFSKTDLKPNGDRKEAAVVGEMGFVVRAEKSCAILEDLDGTVAV